MGDVKIDTSGTSSSSCRSGSSTTQSTAPPNSESASTSNSQSSSSDAIPKADKKYNPSEYEDYGYSFYPERRSQPEKSFAKRVMEGRWAKQKVSCEVNVAWCVENNAMVRLMMRALKNHGCPVKLGRHIACETCNSKISGGFDPDTNQVVVCQNNIVRKKTCCSILAHEFTHMFDHCRAKIDFDNLEHIACTEVRAANFMHCSLLAAMMDGDATPMNISKQHRHCVYRHALNSVLLVRNITPDQARSSVDKVFWRCYRDLEPVGRIPRRASRDPERALSEGLLYGYTD